MVSVTAEQDNYVIEFSFPKCEPQSFPVAAPKDAPVDCYIPLPVDIIKSYSPNLWAAVHLRITNKVNG